MERRDISRNLLLAAAATALVARRAESQSCTAPCYAITAAETAASITPTNYSYPPGDARRYNAKIDGSTDDTAAYVATIAQAKQTGGAHPFWPAGVAVVSSLTLNGANYCVVTEGLATTFQQKASLPDNTQIIVISGSNIALGDLSFRGNISTDGAEYHHCVAIYDPANATAIQNIYVGRLVGTNIRGDVLDVSGTPAAPVNDVFVEAVSGNNIYRNVVSIVGGQDVQIGSITGTNVGFRMIDVEPNTGNQLPHNITVQYIRGSAIGVVGSSGTYFNRDIHFGSVILDQSLQGNSTPGYPSHALDLQIQISDTERLRIDYLETTNFNGVALWAPYISGLVRGEILVGKWVASSGSLTDTTYNTYAYIVGMNLLRVDDGNISLSSSSKFAFRSDTTGNTATFAISNTTVSGGHLAVYGTNCVFRNVTASGTESDYGAGGLTGPIFDGCVLTYIGVPMLGASSNAVFRDCTVTCSQLNGANPDSLILNSTVNGVRYYVGSNGNLSGSVTFAGATSASVTFPVAESDANYRIVLGSSANKVFWWSSKSTSGFTLNASASSTDTIDWMLVR